MFAIKVSDKGFFEFNAHFKFNFGKTSSSKNCFYF